MNDRLIGKRHIIFMNIYMHRKAVNFKEVIRPRGLDTILTKKRGFGLPGTINGGEMTRKCLVETNGR